MPATLPTTPAAPPTVEPEHDRRIDEAGFDSFPASDPPGWWAGAEAPNTSS